MKKYDINKPYELKKGVYKLNDEPNFNYQLNRVINWDGGRLEDILPISNDIKDSNDWKRELIKLGDIALKEERIDNAIAYYRMSEFFMYDGDPDKKKYYELATKLFYEYYEDYFNGDNPIIKLDYIDYKNVKLPVMHLKPEGIPKGKILIHGGNDSYFEEFLFTVLYLKDLGYEVYMFEGPGQGGVVRVQNMHFTYKWEEPVKAVLDYYNLEDITIIGISLGGYLAPRAAAFDSRITKVVAWSVFPCFLDVIMGQLNNKTKKLFKFAMKLHLKPIINKAFKKRAKKSPIIDWGLKHGCYAYEAKDAYGYANKLKEYDIKPVADKITQDMLIIGASKDHFIDYHLINKELDMLTNTKSLTFRLFTDKEEADNHCNVGNGKIVLDFIDSWIEGINNEI